MCDGLFGEWVTSRALGEGPLGKERPPGDRLSLRVGGLTLVTGCVGKRSGEKKVTLITSSFVAGGIKVIKSLVSVTIVLPCLARSKPGSQIGHLSLWMFSFTQLSWNFLRLLKLTKCMFPKLSCKVCVTLFRCNFWCSVNAELSRLETLQSRKSEFLLLV